MNNQVCGRRDHENFQATHLCNLRDCKLQQRWCCAQCIKQRIHQHGKQDCCHIISFQEMIAQQKDEISKLLENQLFSKGLEYCQSLLLIIKEIQELIEQLLQSIENQKEIFQLLLSDLTEENFIKLDDMRINQIIRFNLNQNIKFTSLRKPFEILDNQLRNFETIIKEYKDNLPVSNYIDLKSIKYNVKIIDSAYRSCFASQISNTQQYLAYEGRSRDIIKVYDIQQDKIAKEIQVNNLIYVCLFSEDSSKFFVGYGTNVCSFNVLSNFKKINQLSIHKKGVLNLKIVQNKYLITCSFDTTIRKIDFKRKKQLFKLTGHTKCINAIAYDDVNNMLISGSGDQSIKIWDCGNQCIIINKEQSHPTRIVQIQLINNQTSLLSLDDSSNLYKWRIDLNKKDLFKIQQFKDPYQIYSFYQINLDQNLVLICGYHVKILNDQGETINIFQHKAGNGIIQSYIDFCVYESKQLDNAKYIHIRSACNKLSLFKKKLCWPPHIIEQDMIYQRQYKKQYKKQYEKQPNYSFSKCYIEQIHQLSQNHLKGGINLRQRYEDLSTFCLQFIYRKNEIIEQTNMKWLGNQQYLIQNRCIEGICKACDIFNKTVNGYFLISYTSLCFVENSNICQ